MKKRKNIGLILLTVVVILFIVWFLGISSAKLLSMNPSDVSQVTIDRGVSSCTITDQKDIEKTLQLLQSMKLRRAFIFLYEHQSTWNPNMPLRDLFYISNEYQKLVDHRSLYSSALQKIPAPKFVVFYNGAKKMEDCRISCLSEAYENLTEEPDLELKVITLNVNEGHNRELMEQCKILKEYAQYVARVRKYQKELPLNEAVELAVSECIREDILAEFLSRHRAEVIAMSIFEYDKEWEEKKLREAEYEAGLEKGALGVIKLAKKFQISDEDIICQLCEELDISQEKAEQIMDVYEKQKIK